MFPLSILPRNQHNIEALPVITRSFGRELLNQKKTLAVALFAIALLGMSFARGHLPLTISASIVLGLSLFKLFRTAKRVRSRKYADNIEKLPEVNLHDLRAKLHSKLLKCVEYDNYVGDYRVNRALLQWATQNPYHYFRFEGRKSISHDFVIEMNRMAEVVRRYRKTHALLIAGYSTPQESRVQTAFQRAGMVD